MVAHTQSTPIQPQATNNRVNRVQRGERHRPVVGAGLWAIQSALAALFLFAGGIKFTIPVEMLEQGGMPAAFVYFIGACEVLGAIGLVLPGATRIRPGLTPLAAAGLAIIMAGATITMLGMGAGVGAGVPLVIGFLAGVVVYGRTRVAPQSARSRRPVAQPAR